MWRRSGKLKLTNEVTIINKTYYYPAVNFVSFIHDTSLTNFIVKLFKYKKIQVIGLLSLFNN